MKYSTIKQTNKYEGSIQQTYIQEIIIILKDYKEYNIRELLKFKKHNIYNIQFKIINEDTEECEFTNYLQGIYHTFSVHNGQLHVGGANEVDSYVIDPASIIKELRKRQ
jgi:hypothetical protein